MKSKSGNILSVQKKYPRLVQYLVEYFQATDCHLVTRRNDDNSMSMIAYLVGQCRYDSENLQSAADHGLIERTPDFIAPVTAIPYTTNSAVDLESLGRCPVIDHRFIHSLNIEGFQLKPLTAPPVTTVSAKTLEPANPAPPPSAEGYPLAQISGAPLPPDPLQRQTLIDALRHAAKSEHGIRFIIDENNSNRISYRDLLARAENMARTLLTHLSGN